VRLGLHTRKRAESSPGVLLVRWGLPLAFVIFGVVLLVMSGGHITGVQDNASESNVFTTIPTNRDSMLSAVGVAAIVIALMIVLLGWMLRLNADEAGDRAKEDEARETFKRTGHWPDEDD
jgi:cytochrome bd-type quinol oxidase subunit 1